MTAPKALTRKAGPLPVWAWAALALVAGVVYFRSTRGAASPSGGSPQVGAAATQGSASGQGSSPGDSSANDLLNASDALLAALQSAGGGGFGTSGAAPSSVSQSGSASSPTTVATADPVATDSTLPATTDGDPTIPAGTNVGTVEVNGVPYTGYTQTPSTADPSSPTGNGITPATDWMLGGGQPVLDSSFAPEIDTPAYSVNPDNTQNAETYASATKSAVAI